MEYIRIAHSEKEHLVRISKSKLDFCENNDCVVAVLTYLEYCHNWKKENEHLCDDDIVQYHTLEEISEGVLNLYDLKDINEALKMLEQKGAIYIYLSITNLRNNKKIVKVYPQVYEQK